MTNKCRVFMGNQFVKTIEVDGKRYTRGQAFKIKAIKTIKGIIRTSAITVGVAWIAVGALHFGMANAKTVEVEREVVKTVGIKFEDIPLLVKICEAESGNRQFNKNGNVLRGRVNPSDIGFCQINEYINNDEARKLGYDIYTEEGNKAFAVHLFLTRGYAPWMSSHISNTPNGWSID